MKSEKTLSLAWGCVLIGASMVLGGCGSSDAESSFEDTGTSVDRSANQPASSLSSGGGGNSSVTTSLYAEETAPASANSSTVLIPGLQLDVTVASDTVVDLSTVGSVWWDSGQCTVKFVVDGQPSTTDDAEVGCPTTGVRCMGFQSYYPFSAVRRIKNLSPGSHRIEVQLGSTSKTVCSVMTEPDAVPTRLYVTATAPGAPTNPSGVK